MSDPTAGVLNLASPVVTVLVIPLVYIIVGRARKDFDEFKVETKVDIKDLQGRQERIAERVAKTEGESATFRAANAELKQDIEKVEQALNKLSGRIDTVLLQLPGRYGSRSGTPVPSR